MVELRPLEERIRYYQSLASAAREHGWNPGRIGVDFKKRFGKYPSRDAHARALLCLRDKLAQRPCVSAARMYKAVGLLG